MEKFAVRPDVGAVVRYVDWKIADNADPFFFAMLAQGAPLFREQVFHVLAELQCVTRQCSPALEGFGLAAGNRRFPLGPHALLMRAFNRTEQHVVIEPECVALAERNEI